jgi:hypothetical protein
MSLDVSVYPYGGRTPMPAPPTVLEEDAPAGRSGPLECSRHDGRDDTLHPYGPVGAGRQGYLGRDPETMPYPEGQGMFARLHQMERG